jgi:hypothetical protein
MALNARLLPLCLVLGGCSPITEGRNPGECSDGADNDEDAAVDCADSDCAGAPDCAELEADDDGCLVAGTFGMGGVEGRQSIAVDGYESNGKTWTLIAWGPPDLDPAEPLPVAMFVTRNLPPDDDDLMDWILDEFINMPGMVEDTGYLGAVMIPGLKTQMGEELIGWEPNNSEDEAFFVDALDTLEANFNVNRARIHLLGSHASGAYATQFAFNHADRIASTANQAGGNPFAGNWPAAWLRPVSGMFIHDPNDEFQPESAIEESALMFEAAGAYVERFFDLDSPAQDGHHDWDSEDIWPRLSPFQAGQCLEDNWL